MLINLPTGTFQIDKEDWEKVKHQNFLIYLANGVPYVRTRTKDHGNVDLHRLLMGCPEGLDVDHENRDSLDNRRFNLRSVPVYLNMANKAEMIRNTSGFKGVTRKRNKWQAQIQVLKEDYYLGVFSTPEEAAKAYDQKAIELLGEYALTNERLGKYV